MASSLLVKITFLIVLCMVLSIPKGEAILSCPQVLYTVSPCLGYLMGHGGDVPALCCDGVRFLNNQACNTPDRQEACKCLQTVVQNLPILNLTTLAALPTNCGVDLPFKITPSIDCNKYVHLLSYSA
ncbi:hypothetical protein Fmac_025736 [Flemingia macrophylla]|uniref:Non-specific lipid-transfer protein n=1 Tax=Flemingia macrophylla TaxID=520843 RepID=A0ABD1LT39_9FABA